MQDRGINMFAQVIYDMPCHIIFKYVDLTVSILDKLRSHMITFIKQTVANLK